MRMLSQNITVLPVIALHVPVEEAVGAKQGIDGLEGTVCGFGID